MPGPTAPSLPERRARRRTAALNRGELRWAGRLLATCRVRDLDAAGAQVILDRPALLPDSMDLSIPSCGVRFQAGVRWRKGDRVGLILTDRQEIALSSEAT